MRKSMILPLVFAAFLVITLNIYKVSLFFVKASPEPEASTGAEVNPSAKADLPDNTVIMYVGSPKAFVNGVETQIIKGEPEIAPYIKGGSTFVPIRFIADAFGVTTSWKPETKTAVISAGDMRIIIEEGKSTLKLVKEQTGTRQEQTTVSMNASAENRGSRLYVPARYIAEALENEVFYDRGLIVISKTALSLDTEKDRDYIDGLISKFTGLQRVGSRERLIELLEINADEDNNGRIVFESEAMMDGAAQNQSAGASAAAPPAAPDLARASAEAAKDASSSSVGYSQTNIQVAGVDEADIIKTDGEYIYYVRKGGIEIVRAHTNGSLEQMSRIEAEDNFSYNEIFIDKNKIIAVGTVYTSAYATPKASPFARAEIAVDYAYFPYGAEYSKATVYDTSDKKNPYEERSVEVKGRYISSRKTGGSVCFVTSNPFYYGDIDELAPIYRDSALGANEIPIGWDRVYHFPIIGGRNITSIAGFNIAEPKKAAKIETFLGAGENVYMSESNLYLAANAGYDSLQGSNQTDICKFAISDGDIVYLSKTSIPGELLNQFSMDEFNGHFRAATTVYQYGRGVNNQSNCLYILDSAMNIVGKTENIAPEERIYSVRFMGNRAYMVTFKQVDPLFALDLSNPRAPKIMGALKIPGYSDYLHPYDENHLIGFGKDTTLDKYGNAFYLGMKISLFDITDITNPKEKFVEYIGDRGTDSPILSSHKALLFSKERDLLAFPVSLYEVKGRSGDSTSYGEFSGYYAYVYSLNINKGFELRGRITHLSPEDMLKSSQWGGDYEKSIERLLYIGKQLYSASQSMIMSSSMDTLAEISRLEFK